MAKTNLNIRISPQLKAKLTMEAAKQNQDLSTYLRDNLPELVRSEAVGISFGDEGVKVVSREPRVTHIGERLKQVVADAVETKLYLKTLGINLSDDEGPPSWLRPYLPNIAGTRPNYTPQATAETFSTKDMMDRLTVWKMLEGMERKTTDPDLKTVLKEMREHQEKAIEAIKKTKEEKKDEPNIKELMQWITFYRMAGQPEEAKKYEKILNDQVSKVTDKLHETQLKMVEQQSEWRAKDLERQIMEIKNRPSEFDQIRQISQLSHQDPAIKAYLHKVLGIEEKAELTPEKLGKYIENIKVPLGDILKGLYAFVQQRAQATKEMPPPPIREPSEEELAQKVLPPEALKQQLSTLPIEESPPAPPSLEHDPKTLAREMLIEGKPLDTIVKETGLSPAQIRGMKGGLTKSGILEKEGSE